MNTETKARKTTAATKPSVTEAAKAPAQPPEKKPVTPLERWRMIGEAAYYRAQKRGFIGGNPYEDWVEAERAIDAEYTVDLSRVMTIFDPTEMLAQFAKAFTGVQLPGVDMEAVLQSQRKNVEALTAANQRAFEDARDMLARQLTLVRELMEEAATAAKEVRSAKSAKAVATKQGELMRHALERALVSLREMGELATRAHTEAINAMSARVAESLKEIQGLTQSLKR